jgi:glyoxylase-like metal-dependent hydrolase (beta-lactamase superfamily II)
VLNDGEHVRIGEIEIVGWDTPGHARHHLAFTIGAACFTGDVAGVRLQGTDYLSVAAAPPQFDPAAYLTSLDRLAARNFERLYLTHFGGFADVTSHLARYRRRIGEIHAAVSADMAAGCDAAEIRHRFTERERALALSLGTSEADWQRFEMANAAAICADGVRLSIEKAAEQA